MKKAFIRSTSLVLAILMLLSVAVGCGAVTPKQASAKGQTSGTANATGQNTTVDSGSTNKVISQTETATREELEQMLVSLSKGAFTLADAMAMSDKELKEKVQMYLDQLEGDSGFSTVPDGYDENGALVKPFDQLYPELLENEQVSYSKDALLLKMKNSQKGTVTKEMKAAGVAGLEAIVPMEETTWYKASLKEGTDTKKAMEELRALSTVLMVDYDYEVKTTAIDHYKELPGDKGYEHNKHHHEQWYLHHAGIPDGFEHMKNDGGSSSVVVAVIDTGVDYDHEDLAQNIWVNKGEIPDDGVDNDGNGYIDDYYGVNIITGKGNGDDDNGHGTHVAGIIAAQNNKLGIVGIAYNTKIMPIKAAMASGYLHQSDIAKAVLYAYEHGAEVINMSFGGTACSIAVQDALATAYTRCVLVASAGNNGAYNEGLGAIPNYPAALTYVLGVMSVDQDGKESYFTNYDVKAFNGVEYELYAPGSEIVSTIPGDRYATWSGTSMAAPMVSAIAAILRSEFTDRDTYPTRFIYGQLCATSEYYATCLDPSAHGLHNIPQIVNLHAALTKLPKPELGVQDSVHFDTIDGNGDGVIDAGETIDLGLILRNRWGQSKDTLVTIDTLSQAGIADPYIEILNDTVNYGSVGSYATGDCGKIFTDELLTGWENPFRIKIANDCPNDYIFTLNITIRCKNGLDPEDDTTYVFGEKPYQFTLNLTVRNGTILPAIIDEDMTLTPDHLYVIPNATVINEGVTVRVEPGTRIQFWSDDPDDPYADTYMAYLLVKGRFLVNGTAENPVYIFPSDLMDHYNIEIAQNATGYVSLRYADITNFVHCWHTNTGYNNTVAYADGCTFRFNYDLYDMYYRQLDSGKVSTYGFYGNNGYIGTIRNAVNCVFYKLGNTRASIYLYGTYEHCAFVDCGIQYSASLRYCLLLGNNFVDQTKPDVFNNSSLMVYHIPDTSVPYLYHCKENGTTYFYGPVDSFWAKKIGADYAIFETAEEWDQFTALDPSRGAHYQVYTRYDADKDRFVWADGSEIGAFADPDGVAISPKNINGRIYIEEDYATGDHRFAYGNYATYYYLYELKGNILPESIHFNEYEVSIDTGATYQISPICTPVQLPLDRFVYECSDPSVLYVDANGKVTPLKEGTADVVVYSLDRAVKNYITFHVVDYVPLAGISLDKSELRLAVGEYAKLNCLFTPANTTRKHAIFTVADDSIAAVDASGGITALSSGKTTLTVTCEGFTATAEITVFVRATEFDFELPAVTYPLAEGEVSLPALAITEGAVTDIVYRSTEPGVASIANGKLILHKAGTTDIIAREQNSGLVAKITLYVTNGALSPVVDLKISGSDDYYALLENGDLYHWSSTQKKPILVAQNVKAFDAYDAYTLVLYQDNTLAELYSGSVRSTWNDFKDRAPIDVGYNGNGGSSYYVLTENGRAYAWGNNDYGTLGVGSVAETVDRPTIVNLDAKIVDIHVSYYDTTWFVTEDGALYMAGAQNLQASTPILIAEGISAAWMEECHLYYIDADGQLVYMEGFSESTDVRGEAPAFTLITGGYGSWNNTWGNNYLTYDNNTLTFHNGNRTTVLPTFGKVTAMAWLEYNGSTFWYATEDGMLYAFGSNRYNQFGGAITDLTSDKPVAIPLFGIEGDVLTFDESNLSEGNVLNENTLVLTFNHILTSCSSIRMYSECLQIPFTARIELNKLYITLGVGYETGKSYGIVIPKDALTGTAGVTLTEDIVLSFGYETTPELGFDPESGHVLGDWYVCDDETGEERRDCRYCDFYQQTELIDIAPQYGAWENWLNSPNNPNGVGSAPGVTQLLVGITKDGSAFEISSDLIWKLHIVGEHQDKTITLSPATVIGTGTYYVHRFETCLAEGENQFIPSKGFDYTVTIEVFDGDTPLYFSKAVSGFTCPMDPVLPDGGFGGAPDHVYDDWYVTLAPTCTEKGTEQRDCTLCEYYETRVVAATGHSHESVVTPPTCTTKGYTTHTCHCGDSYVDSYVKATGHSHEAVVTPPTCTDHGYVTYTCHCGHSYVVKYTDVDINDTLSITLGADGTDVTDTLTDGDLGLYVFDTGLVDLGSWSNTPPAGTCYIEIDLKNIYMIDSICAFAPSVGDNDPFIVQKWEAYVYAADSASWVKVGGKLNSDVCTDEGYTLKLNTPVAGRYIRLYGVYESRSDWHFQLSEVSVGLYPDAALAATGHSFGEWYKTSDFTCTELGEERRDCETCGHDETQEVFGHSFGAWYVVSDPDCTTEGEERRDCTECDHFETSVIPATGHSYESVVTPPTCTEHGYVTYTCHCGDSYVVKYSDVNISDSMSITMGKDGIDVTNTLTNGTRDDYIDLGFWADKVTEPAYGTDGTCYIEIDLKDVRRIGSIWVVTLPMESRVYKWEAYVSSDNTADISTWIKIGGKMNDDISTEEGYTLQLETPVTGRYIRLYGMYNSANEGFHFSEVKVMGAEIADENLAAPGHSYGDWYVTVEKTCTTDGEEQRDCANCDHFETRVVAAAHDYDEWYVTTEETCTTDGEEQRDCKNCDHFETRTVAAAHSFGEWYVYDSVTGSSRRDCENCDHYEVITTIAITVKPSAFGEWENWGSTMKTNALVSIVAGDNGAYNEMIMTGLRDGIYTLRIVLTDETAGRTYIIPQYFFDTPNMELYIASPYFFRFAFTEYAIPLTIGNAYTIQLDVYEEGALLFTGSTASGEFDDWTKAPEIIINSVPHDHQEVSTTTASVAMMNSASTEKVVHESVTDSTVVRYYTAETLSAKFAEIQQQYQYNPTFYGNVILNHISTDYTVEHWLRPLAPESSGTEIPLGGNYWGSTNKSAIELQMIDYRDFITYGLFMYEPFLESAPENTFPFVTDIQIFNKEGEEVTTVGREEITVRVHFNRDMDTTVPLSVLFGSAYPYGDYEITNGSYIDARTWEGTYFVTTVIGDGNQYFTVTGGKAAGTDMQLFTDRQRFGFVIDTFAAQALIMQGEATETGISLSWTQDDFDTLMGYNVYRATSEDGQYVRINPTVIPADTMSFFDDNVEPGVRYFYNFTVVQTDLTESIPSGKIALMSMDTMAPNVYHSPVYTASSGANLIVSATVTDNLHIVYAKVYYRTVGSEAWSTAMMNSLNDKFSAIIPADALSLDGMEYYIEAFDGVSYTYKGSADSPYKIVVQEAVNPNSLGDVNGDGTITNLDALMLLQAINDLLNLDSAQFARADLNGDGELAAVEALRILQYVSGKVGSVAM